MDFHGIRRVTMLPNDPIPEMWTFLDIRVAGIGIQSPKRRTLKGSNHLGIQVT